MRYAVWYDNCTGFLEAAVIIEANTPEEVIASAYVNGLPLGAHIAVTDATLHEKGFGNDPNVNRQMILTATIDSDPNIQ